MSERDIVGYVSAAREIIRRTQEAKKPEMDQGDAMLLLHAGINLLEHLLVDIHTIAAALQGIEMNTRGRAAPPDAGGPV